MDRLRKIIGGRVTAVLAHGASVNELEKRIEEFKKFDICWTTFNQFPIMEKFILNKINKNLSIVYDSSSITMSLAKEYDEEIRIPRLTDFLSRKDNNLWITTLGIVRDYMKPFGFTSFLQRFSNKIMIIDDYIPQAFLQVPNSLTLVLGCMAIGGASTILLFGADGYKGNYKDNINSFYKPEYQAKERIASIGNTIESSVTRDAEDFQNRFMRLYRTYCQLHAIVPPTILNVSPISSYNIFQKLTYDEVIKWLHLTNLNRR